MPRKTLQLPELQPGQAFPPVDQAWGQDSPACGLLAAGGRLDVPTLVCAYSSGIFPWFSEGQPILWWSTDPRMALDVRQFKLRRSLKQSLQRFTRDAQCQIRIDTAFEQVITACAQTLRERSRGALSASSSGTWIVPDMINAYCALHRAGFAHSVEAWVKGELVGGLYCVALGKAVFGESMFSLQTDVSKIALAALVCFCRHQGIALIDCQQNTGHLASLGATEIARSEFLAHVKISAAQPAPPWYFDDLYWRELLPLLPPRDSET